MDFSKALKLVRGGERVARKEWPEGKYLFLVVPQDKKGRDMPGYIAVRSPVDGIAGWNLRPGDLLAEDWWVPEEKVEEAAVVAPVAPPEERRLRPEPRRARG